MKVVGVRFRRAGKVYPFDPGEMNIRRDMMVIVDTPWGIEMGSVVYTDYEKKDEKEVRKVIRIANAQDLKAAGKNREKEAEAFRIGQEKIARRGLAMNLVSVEYTFDGSKILFYFTAENRIDFRELVKDLASVFHTRIELRQIGVRDETKILGGLGICGRVLCCTGYLSEFAPVSIRMAKDQNLSLNPAKISGSCGRLMCCLKNEQETYEYLNSKMPSVGETVLVKADGAKGTVQSTDVMRQRVKVLFTLPDGSTDLRDYPVEELKLGQHRRRAPRKLSEEEMKEVKELSELEKDDSCSKLD